MIKKDADLSRKKAGVSETLVQEAEIKLRTRGQRRINIIWEITQAFVAVSVTLATLYISSTLALKNEAQTAAFLLLSNAFFLVVGFYFGRTNHQRIGGIGTNSELDGRR